MTGSWSHNSAPAIKTPKVVPMNRFTLRVQHAVVAAPLRTTLATTIAQYQLSSSTVWPINRAISAPTLTVTATAQSALNASTCIGRSTCVQLCVCNKPKVTFSKTLKSTLLVVTTSTWTRLNHSAGMVATAPEAKTATVPPRGCHLDPTYI